MVLDLAARFERLVLERLGGGSERVGRRCAFRRLTRARLEDLLSQAPGGSGPKAGGAGGKKPAAGQARPDGNGEPGTGNGPASKK